MIRALACPICLLVSFACIADETFEEKARRIHAEAFVLDTHADTTPKFEDPYWDISKRNSFGHVDIPRLHEGGFDAIFWSVYMGKTPGEGRATKRALRRIDSIYETIRRHPHELMLATTAEDIRIAARLGKIACLMGVEGGHIIEDELTTLRMFHRLGVRYMTLTHSFHTNWADSSGEPDKALEGEHGGLTAFGREVVLEMNRLGMMVDISHVADTTFWDAIECSKAPLIASHSSARAVSNHHRNMSDDMIRALAAGGGVININFYPAYIDARRNTQPENVAPRLGAISAKLVDGSDTPIHVSRRPFPTRKTPASVVVDHIVHVIDLVGAEHVGLGADWDGVPDMPEGLEDVSKVPYITEELLRRGLDEESIKMVLGGNMLRVMEETQRVAEEMAGTS